MIIQAIISGGQTGADQGGLFAAKELGIATGGIVPAGWKTEAGPAKWLEEYGLLESSSPDYTDRTKDNVMLAHGTIIFGKRSVGSNKTEGYCRSFSKPVRWIGWPAEGNPVGTMSPQAVRLWLMRSGIKTLNVAGNRESKNPGIGQFTKDFLIKVLK